MLAQRDRLLMVLKNNMSTTCCHTKDTGKVEKMMPHLDKNIGAAVRRLGDENGKESVEDLALARELMKPHTVDNWEKDFEQEFGNCQDYDPESFKDFIKTLLQSGREEAYRDGQKHAFGVDRKRVAQEIRDSLVERLEEFIDDNDDGTWSCRETADTILTMIKETL